MDFESLENVDYERAFDALTTNVGQAAITIVALLITARLASWFLKRMVDATVDRTAQARGMTPDVADRRRTTLRLTVSWCLNTFFGFLVVATILTTLGLDIAALFAAAGVIGIALGFGAQTFVRDLINGMFILLEDQYGIGDIVQIADVDGEVVDINPRRTLLRDLDGSLHSVPNGAIERSTNKTRGFSRINLDVSVAYEEDLGAVIATINEVCEQFANSERAHIIKTPSVLRVNALGASGIDIRILGDVIPGSQWDLTGKLRQQIKAAFDAKGIEIPYPHQVNVEKVAKPAEAATAGS